MTDTFEQRLAAVMRSGDVDGARALLDDLDGDELRDARRRFAKSRRWPEELLEWDHLEFDDIDERLAVWNNVRWVEAMCAVRLAGPTTAAKRVPWQQFWNYREDPGEAAFVQLLWDTDREWVAQFVEASSHARLGGNARNCQEQLARVLRAVALHHGLPCPTGSTFIDCWWAGTGRNPWLTDSLADRFAEDPFMPDLLPLYLSSGDCGSLPKLPAAVAALVERGVVDREAIIEHVLQTLTAPQRPKSQKVLAEILDALGLAAAEVPGGLTFLLGVMATGDRSVVPVLLPVALQAATDGVGLEELSRVVAHRPEKRPRTMLLSALKDDCVVGRFGRESVLTALAALRTGEDAAFDATVDKALAALGVTPTSHDAGGPSAIGLWDLEPSLASPAEDPEPTSRARLTWDHALTSTHPGRVEHWALLVDRAVRAMAGGRLDTEALLESFRSRLLLRCLSTSSLAAVLEDLFLAGGMRQLWPTAVQMTDEACAANHRPSGLADLLRTMGRYAVEVPHPWGLPEHVRQLARSKGKTKARAEARAFAAALLGVSAADGDLDRLIDEASSPTWVQPEPRGLWSRRAPSLRALPSNRRVHPPGGANSADLRAELRHRLAEEFRTPPGYGGGTYYRTDGFVANEKLLPGPDLALATLVLVAQRHGADAVREVLDEVQRYPGIEPVDVLAAVDLWVAGDLAVSTFWTMASASVISETDLRQQWYHDRSLSYEDCEERWRALPPFAERLREHAADAGGPLVVPRSLASGAERTHFLRACEALLRADAYATVLSTPTRADGTLELDDLLVRLAEIRKTPDSTVGPIDLVQALHRMRPVEKARAQDVPDGPCTDPRFTHPDAAESWDAGALIRRWIIEGGLPELEPRPDGQGGWCTEAVAPVPFTDLAALPRDLLDDPWSPGPIGATARMMPLWADRTVVEAFATIPYFVDSAFPGHLASRGGVPMMDLLIAALESDGRRVSDFGSRQAWRCAADFAQRGRLDPRTLAVAGWRRHQAGALDVEALTENIRLTFEVPGAFSWWWVSAAALADALCRVPDPPTGAARLLQLLATYAVEIPSDFLKPTPGVVAVAEGQVEVDPATRAAAHDLVAALARRPG